MVPDDPHVHEVEQCLDRGAGRLDLGRRSRWIRRSEPVRPTAELALWLCACNTYQESPGWLIIGDDESAAWCRLPDGMEVRDLVDVQHAAGGHMAPAEVLEWLRGERASPGDLSGDAQIAIRLGRTLRRS